MKATFHRIAIVVAFIWTSQANAQDTSRQGKISRVDVTSAENYGFRVYFDNAAMCTGGQPWAYMNKSWSNYDAAASVLTSAWMSGKTVTVISSKTAAGYCEIVYVAAY